MPARTPHAELATQLTAFGAVRRGLARAMPPDCQLTTLAVLGLLSDQGDMRMSRLADLLGTDLSVASRQVAHLAERGWIDRDPDPADRRSRILRVTALGRLALERAHERYTEVLAHQLGEWPDEDVTRLAELLARLRASFDHTAPAGRVQEWRTADADGPARAPRPADPAPGPLPAGAAD
jgi:DNA-binding MarR family transcriptional regulator